MTKIVEYIMQNYTWFLTGAIIILLAIIGSYADKTNFGQGKDKSQDDEKEKNNLDFANKRISDNLESNELNSDEKNVIDEKSVKQESFNYTNVGNKDTSILDEISEPDFSSNDNAGDINENTRDSQNLESKPIENSSKQNELINNNVIQKLENNKKDDFDENFNKFDEEFNTLVPKKDIIDSDILDDIDDLSLDKSKKSSLNNIPDLDDVELPKIKNLKSEDENIWKF